MINYIFCCNNCAIKIEFNANDIDDYFKNTIIIVLKLNYYISHY